MNPVAACYYDGRVSTRHQVQLKLEGADLRLQGDGLEASYPLARVLIAAGVGAVRRRIRLPDGGVCEVCDEEFAAELERRQGRGHGNRLIHRWERSVPLVVAGLAILALVVTLFLRLAVPVLARHVAFALPPAVETALGRESLATLDTLAFTPTKLPAARRQELTALFRRMTARLPGTAACRLEFRASSLLGANALALPGGIVVVTDGLVQLAKNDDELAGVLAHELGHVQGRHALRHVLQNSATGLLLATLTGDILSVTSFSATLPTTLVDASFSRDFEREADGAAIGYLQQAAIPPHRYAEILARLQAQLDTRRGTAFAEKSPVRNYLSTHPDTGERILRIVAAEKGSGGQRP
jgi:predicted Zn-dependent protease